MTSLRFCLILLTALYLIQDAYAIKGSVISTKGQFAFQAYLTIKIKSTTLNRTGSLISKNYVLTAASNVQGSQKITVILGAHNIVDKQEPSRRTYDGVSFKVHEKYTEPNGPNNIALVKLNQPAELSGFIKTIPIARFGFVCLSLIGRTVRISGWGDVTAQSPPEYQVLRYADVQIKLYLSCRANFPLISYKHLCTSDTTKYFEQNDIGAPLVLGSNQVGVAASTNIANGVATGGPQMFAKLDTHLEWIEMYSDLVIEE